jgi:Arc/MetJ-type ribon-helix-helix transcriptional regulator
MVDVPKNELVERSIMSGTEKMTINIGVVDLGQIDLLVREGFYSNRTDLVRTAIRNQLSTHAEAVNRIVARQSLHLGLQHISRLELERALGSGQLLNIRAVGLVRIADDVSPKLARAAIQSIAVLGALHASPAVRSALADRITR